MTDNGHPTAVPAVQPDPTPESLREAMARFATGITVLTALGEHCRGMTANAFSSVSLDPPLVLCCINRTAQMHSTLVSARAFAVSVLRADQEHLAHYFADGRRPSGRAQFDAVDWVPGPCTGAPLLSGALAWLECALVDAYGGGDHSIFVGQVLSTGCGMDEDALVFFGGTFRRVV